MVNRKLQTSFPYIGLAVIIVLFTILTSGTLLEGRNLLLITEQSLMILVSAVGVLFVMSMGSLDFSQGSIAALSAYVVVLLASLGVPMILAFVCGFLVGMAIGFLNGFIHAKFKIVSFVVTISTMYIFRGLEVFLATNYLAKSAEIFKYDQTVPKLIIIIAIVLIGFFLYHYTRIGRDVRAIGSGETAARFSGVKVESVKILAFALAGGLAAVSGILAFIRAGSVTTETSLLLETNVMIALVLGGLPISGGSRSRYSAVVIGTVMLGVLGNGLVLMGANVIVQQLIKGIVFLATIIITTDRSSGMASK